MNAGYFCLAVLEVCGETSKPASSRTVVRQVIVRKIIETQKQTARSLRAREKQFNRDYSCFQITGQADVPKSLKSRA
jgi:hypothetical protein